MAGLITGLVLVGSQMLGGLMFLVLLGWRGRTRKPPTHGPYRDSIGHGHLTGETKLEAKKIFLLNSCGVIKAKK